MSLDGFVVGPQDSVDAPMGVEGFRLFNWLDHRLDPGPNGQVFAEMNATRAVIAGRRTYEHADRWHGDHHDGVPVFVLTHHVPQEPPPGSVHYVTDVHACAARARAAAGDADVVVQGAGAAQALLRAGELDEMELHVVPVLLGRGRRLFDHLPAEPTDGLRVADPDRALAFYTALGYEVVGRVPETPVGQLTMLELADDDVVRVELVLDPTEAGRDGGTGLSHFVISVERMDATITDLRAKGIEVAEPEFPDGPADFLTTWITDPDGNRIELVQWPPGHPDGITAADWS